MSGLAISYRSSDQALLWGLFLSVVVHGLLATQMSPFSFEDTAPRELRVELQPPAPPPPPPPAEPEPPKPEPPKPQPKPLPKKPLPDPTPVKLPEPPPAALPVEAPPPPQVIAAAPKAEEPPAFVAPPPPPEPPKLGPTQQDIDAARGLYGSQLAKEFAKHRQYPRVAMMRGWQGTVKVQLEIDADGNVTSSSINESSGHEVLDKQALEMVKKASPLPLPPEALRNSKFSILVPVTFRLE